MYTLSELRQHYIKSWGKHGQLRIKNSKFKVWLHDDDHKLVTVEKLRRGKWYVVRQYVATDSGRAPFAALPRAESLARAASR